jgi:hypothetical protein
MTCHLRFATQLRKSGLTIGRNDSEIPHRLLARSSALMWRNWISDITVAGLDNKMEWDYWDEDDVDNPQLE